MRYEMYFLNGKCQSAYDFNRETLEITFIGKKETIFDTDSFKAFDNAERNIQLIQVMHRNGYDKKDIYRYCGLSESPTHLSIFNTKHFEIRKNLRKQIGVHAKYILNQL